MNKLPKYLSMCLLATAALLGGTFPAFAANAPSSNFAVLSAAFGGAGAVTCTNSTITGDVGSSGLPASVVQTGCAITGAIIAPVSSQVLTDFNNVYSQYAATPCTGSLATAYTGTTLTLTPGVYCNAAGVTFTDTTLTLDGQSDANAVWIFKIGTGGTGALTGTNFSVVMANSAQQCNVYWWVAEAATMTTSDFKGSILAGAAITLTGGTFAGRALAKGAVTLTGVAATGCGGGTFNPPKQRCNQGVGNGPEGCDPGNSNQSYPFRSNDELGGVPGNPGRKGGNK